MRKESSRREPLKRPDLMKMRRESLSQVLSCWNQNLISMHNQRLNKSEQSTEALFCFIIPIFHYRSWFCGVACLHNSKRTRWFWGRGTAHPTARACSVRSSNVHCHPKLRERRRAKWFGVGLKRRKARPDGRKNPTTLQTDQMVCLAQFLSSKTECLTDGDLTFLLQLIWSSFLWIPVSERESVQFLQEASD